MSAGPFLISLPVTTPVRPLYDGKDAFVVFADTSAIAIKMAAAQNPGNVDAMWATADAVSIAAGSDLTGYSLHAKVSTAAGVVKADITVGSADGGVKATKDFTISSITALDGQTVTIGTHIYTFKTNLTGPTTADEVHIGASTTTAAANLTAAINNAGGTPGTDYGSDTVAHTSVNATNPSAGVVRATAKVAGTAGNAIALDENCTNSAWTGGAVFLTGGVNAASVDGLGTAAAAALAAITATSHASYTVSTGVLIAAAGASDALGDGYLEIEIYGPASQLDPISVPDFVGTVTQAGLSSDDLKVTLLHNNEVPSVPYKLRAGFTGG